MRLPLNTTLGHKSFWHDYFQLVELLDKKPDWIAYDEGDIRCVLSDNSQGIIAYQIKGDYAVVVKNQPIDFTSDETRRKIRGVELYYLPNQNVVSVEILPGSTIIPRLSNCLVVDEKAFLGKISIDSTDKFKATFQLKRVKTWETVILPFDNKHESLFEKNGTQIKLITVETAEDFPDSFMGYSKQEVEDQKDSFPWICMEISSFNKDFPVTPRICKDVRFIYNTSQAVGIETEYRQKGFLTSEIKRPLQMRVSLHPDAADHKIPDAVELKIASEIIQEEISISKP